MLFYIHLVYLYAHVLRKPSRLWGVDRQVDAEVSE